MRALREKKRKTKEMEGLRAKWLQLFAATLAGSMNSPGERGARNPFGRESACVL